MLRQRAFRPATEKIVRLQFHPTQPWIVSADFSDNVVVWNWEHRQVIYELNAGGVDERRLVGAQLQKIADGETESKVKISEAIRGGSVRQVTFYDEDTRFWQAWTNRMAATESPAAANQQFPNIGGAVQGVKGRHFLVICCENKVIFLDMVTMRARDVPKQSFDNKSPLCMEFLSRSANVDGPLVAFGGSDGTIRVLSIATWQLVRRYTGGHKGSVSCLATFLSSSGEAFLVSGASDGLIVLWSTAGIQDNHEMVPKSSIKAHDGGVIALELARVSGATPQLVSIGADKMLAVWDAATLKELKRSKVVSKVACSGVATWCHPRAPSMDVLTCVRDSNIWGIQHASSLFQPRPLCDLSSQVPQNLLSASKKLKCYCLAVHPLQPQLIASGTNVGVILSEFEPKAIPAAVALPTLPGSKEHTVACVTQREIKLLTFQLSSPLNPSLSSVVSSADTGRPRADPSETIQLQVKQIKKRMATIPQDVYSILSISKSGRYVSVVCPDLPHYAVYRVSDWSQVDSGSARHFAWDSCKERYALLETGPLPRMPPPAPKGKGRKEAAAQAMAAAAAAAASAAASATVQVRIILDDGSVNLLTKSIEGRPEPVIGLQGGALLGVAYKLPRRFSQVSAAATASQAPSYMGTDDGGSKSEVAANFQLYSWETFKPVSGLLPQPEWTAWDQTVEYCALAYHQYVVIASLRPQYRYLGNVAIGGSTGGVWHRRQLFLATPTTIECVFVDAGVSPIDLERIKRKQELKVKEAQVKSVAEHGELALISVDNAQPVTEQRIPLRPPMLQVVRLASFQHAPSIPHFTVAAKQLKPDVLDEGGARGTEERKPAAEVAVAGGGVSVAVSRLPQEQKRPAGSLVVIGVKDGVLWLVDRYMTAHAIALGHPGIRCRCLAAYGDPVSAVKWATRLAREHHDDLAQFMLGMGYAAEALHLPGISKRLEFGLCLESNDIKRALQCLLTLTNSRHIGQDLDSSNDPTGLMSLSINQEKMMISMQGIAKFAKEFIDLIDAADATGQTDIASQALRRLAAAGSVKGGLSSDELRGLALRLAAHGELTRLGVLVNKLIASGQGREAALAAALLNDTALLEKSWQDTGILAEAALHAQAHGRPSFKSILQLWNQSLQKENSMPPPKKPLAASEPEFMTAELTQTARPPLIEVMPPGNFIPNTTSIPISGLAMGKTLPLPAVPNGQQIGAQPSKPLLLEGPSGPNASGVLLLEGPPPSGSTSGSTTTPNLAGTPLTNPTTIDPLDSLLGSVLTTAPVNKASSLTSLDGLLKPSMGGAASSMNPSLFGGLVASKSAGTLIPPNIAPPMSSLTSTNASPVTIAPPMSSLNGTNASPVTIAPPMSSLTSTNASLVTIAPSMSSIMGNNASPSMVSSNMASPNMVSSNMASPSMALSSMSSTNTASSNMASSMDSLSLLGDLGMANKQLVPINASSSSTTSSPSLFMDLNAIVPSGPIAVSNQLVPVNSSISSSPLMDLDSLMPSIPVANSAPTTTAAAAPSPLLDGF